MDLNNTEILNAALEYHTRGFSVIPMSKDKRPAVKWKAFQTHRADKQQLKKWFSDGQYLAMAVILGKVSGDLACRDFDEAESYHQWKARHPELAKSLPTVKTGRGFHVYFRCPGCKLEKFSDGELRGAGGCCLLPPSPHPSGGRYEWIVSLPDGSLQSIDPTQGGFVPLSGELSVLPRAAEQRSTRAAEQQKQCNRVLKGVNISGNNSPELKGKGPDPGRQQIDLQPYEKQITEAIDRTLPTKAHCRNSRIFEFARELKAIPQLASVDPRLLRAPVQKWHKGALAVITTKDFESSWADFLYAWGKVRFPKGTFLMDECLTEARAHLIDCGYENPKIRELLSLCRVLQEKNAESPFFLSSHDVGRLLDVDHKTALSWLFLLEVEEWLQVVEKGNSHRATRYRYLGKEIEQ